jgi:hypothetical protein
MRVLFSYHYFQGTDLVEKVREVFPARPEVFVDSGAFSAKTQGEEIHLPSYCQFIRDNAEVIDWYANLDVIGSAEETWQNQKAMEKRGLEPIPVFHVNEDWEYLERYVEEYPLVALGGLVPHMRYTDRIMPWLVKAFKIGEGKCVFHGFGVTSWDLLSRLPWYSFDSTTWRNPKRYGKLTLFEGHQGFTPQLTIGTDEVRDYAGLIRELGGSVSRFVHDSMTDTEALGLAVLSMMECEAHLQDYHGGVDLRRSDPGPNCFLASSDERLSHIAAAIKWLTHKTATA